jgi:outer membrane lipoprotein-sorting protein
MPLRTFGRAAASVWLFAGFFLLGHTLAAGEAPAVEKLGDIAERVQAAFEGVSDYSCEVEQTYFRDGSEYERYRFNYYFKRGKRIRVDFAQPYPGTTVLYRSAERDATVLPFRFMPMIHLQYPIDDPAIKTPTGQRIDQTDLSNFVDFLSRAAHDSEQTISDALDDEGEIRFTMEAKDYLAGARPERYRIVLSKDLWLPLRIERYDQDGRPIEWTVIRHYVLNGNLNDALFLP